MKTKTSSLSIRERLRQRKLDRELLFALVMIIGSVWLIDEFVEGFTHPGAIDSGYGTALPDTQPVNKSTDQSGAC